MTDHREVIVGLGDHAADDRRVTGGSAVRREVIVGLGDRAAGDRRETSA
ncbi:MAG: hypothetical protein HOV79_28530 [Hamadaea sp.]|nr:hypothetical protein [Hamadaea sp.]